VRDHRQQQAWAHASLNTPRSALTIQDAAAPVLAVVTDMDVDNSSGVPIVIDDELAADDAALDFDIHFEIEMECDEPELDARSTRSTGKQTQPHTVFVGDYTGQAIMAALVHRTVSGQGQYIDASIHEACALTTEAAIANYVYRGEVLLRQTGRHHAAAPTPRTQYLAKDGTYVTALITGGLNPRNITNLAKLMDRYGMAGDLHDQKYQEPAAITENASHIYERLAGFIAGLPAEEVYHAAQESGFTWGAVRMPETLLDDAHLADRGFWKQVEHPELGRSFIYPGEAAIYNGSPWRIARRAPLIGEHNVEIYCEELGLSRGELAVLAESGVV